MTPLLLRAGLRHLVRRPWQGALSVLGIALGVAVVLGMELAVDSTREAFRVSSETVAGRATHTVVPVADGLPDDLFVRLRTEAGVRPSAPVVTGYVTVDALADRPVRLLGVDPFSESPFRPFLERLGDGGEARVGGPGIGAQAGLIGQRGGVLLSRETAAAGGLGLGDSIQLEAGGRARVGWVAGILDPSDPLGRQGLRDLLVVDLSDAQDLLGRRGRLDRIDLIIPEDPGGEEVLATVRSILPPGVAVEPAGVRAEAMAGMIRAFELNLRALSLLALLFGLFLIYNTMTFSVVSRRESLATLRCVGVTPGRLQALVLAEAGVVGAAGSGLGLGLGILLGEGLVGLVARTVNDLYFVVTVTGTDVAGGHLARAAALGLMGTMVASLVPAREASRTSPREALTRSLLEEGRVRGGSRAVAIGAVLGALGVGALLLPTRDVHLAFVGIFALVVGMAMITPTAGAMLVRGALPLLSRLGGVVGTLAGRGVLAARSRTGPALAALVVAVAVTVGLGVMIQSFRSSVASWLEVTLQADLYVAVPPAAPGAEREVLPGELAGLAAGLPSVEGVSTYRARDLGAAYGMATLVAVELDPRSEGSYELLEGSRGGAFTALREEGAVLISEPLSYRVGEGAGGSIGLPTPAGEQVFPVAGVFRDYGSDRGTVIVDRLTHDRYFDDDGLTSLGLFLSPGADQDAVASALRAGTGEGAGLEIRSNRAIREASLAVFDRTFQVTVALRALAFLVAFIAVLSALMSLQLERGRELAILRAGGMTPAQVGRMVTGQTGLMGLVAGLLSLPVGLVVAWVMIFVVNRRSFGWTLEMEVGPGVLSQAVLLAVVGALLAGIYPAWRMSRVPASRALQEE